MESSHGPLISPFFIITIRLLSSSVYDQINRWTFSGTVWGAVFQGPFCRLIDLSTKAKFNAIAREEIFIFLLSKMKTVNGGMVNIIIILIIIIVVAMILFSSQHMSMFGRVIMVGNLACYNQVQVMRMIVIMIMTNT